MDNSNEIKARITAGESPEAIAIRLGVDLREIESVADDLSREKRETQSTVDLLRENLKVLQKLVPTAQWVYESSPDVDNAAALTQLISTSLQTIKEIESRKDPAIVMNEVLAKVMQPIFRDFVKHITVETSKARTALDQAVPNQHHAAIDTILKDIVKGVGRLLSRDYKESVGVLAATLGCKAQDEKVKPMLKVVEVEEADEPQTDAGSENRQAIDSGR